MADETITLYRGMLVRQGTPVQGVYPNQMASTNPYDALHYGVNPPGYGDRFAPANGDELVLTRFNVTRSQVFNPYGGPDAPLDHVFVNDNVDITRLPGYQEMRVPLSEVATPNPDGGARVINEARAQELATRLARGCGACGVEAPPARAPAEPAPRPAVRPTVRPVVPRGAVGGALGILGLPSLFMMFLEWNHDPRNPYRDRTGEAVPEA